MNVTVTCTICGTVVCPIELGLTVQVVPAGKIFSNGAHENVKVSVPCPRVTLKVSAPVPPTMVLTAVDSGVVSTKGTPVPDKLTICGSCEALSAMESVADSAPPPTTLGAKVTLIVQMSPGLNRAPGESVVPQFPLSEKSPAFAPVSVGITPVRLPVVLVFVRVTVIGFPATGEIGNTGNSTDRIELKTERQRRRGCGGDDWRDSVSLERYDLPVSSRGFGRVAICGAGLNGKGFGLSVRRSSEGTNCNVIVHTSRDATITPPAGNGNSGVPLHAIFVIPRRNSCRESGRIH